MTREMIFTFIGGAIVGASGAVMVMKQTGYVRLTEEQEAYLAIKDQTQKLDEDGNTQSDATVSIKRDETSFDMSKAINTHKIRYDNLEDKPDLEELASKYENEENNEDTDGSDGDDIYDENDDPDPDLAYVDFPDDDEDLDYGHIILQLPAKRKDQLIYLIPQDYAGELYLLEDLTYYEKDDILTDVTDAPIDDPMSVIGDSLGYFGQHGADEDKLFVRNCTMGIEYEITRVHGRFADKLYGVDTSELENEPKKGIRRMRKEREDE